MWEEKIEKMLDAEPPETAEEWQKHCIFRVPPHFKMSNGAAFKPQAVTLGPFHHDRDRHAVMEAHKRRAVRHLLRRAGKTARELAAAVEAVAEELEDAYAGLGAEWRGDDNRGRFLEVMVADGCFLLEVMRNYTMEIRRKDSKHCHCNDYAASDPVFSPHAVVHIAAFLQRDMLMIENQLPLLVIQRIVAVEGGPSDVVSINKLVLEFLCVDSRCATYVGEGLGLHPLQLYRRSLLRPKAETNITIQESHGTICGCHRRRSRSPGDKDDEETGAGDDDDEEQGRRERSVPWCYRRRALKQKAAPRSAQKLWEGGIRFRPSATALLDDVGFRRRGREVSMPPVTLDDSTGYKLRNVMAFEALHAGTGNDVTAFVRFARDMVGSPADVALLARMGILRNELAGDDSDVVRLFRDLTRDVARTRQSRLCRVHEELEHYCRISWVVRVFQWWAELKSSYLSSPWKLIGLLAAVFLLATNVTQTEYAALSYDPNKPAS